jgi:hypothetical protein
MGRKRYDCTECAPEDRDLWVLGETKNMFIMMALESLISILSEWKPKGDLVLDVGVY